MTKIKKEQENSKSEQIITNDNIIDQGKKVKFKVPIDFLGHTEYIEYITDQRGLDHFKTMLDPNKDQREYDQAEAMENLSFIDGVLITWKIFDRILKKQLTDENGKLEKDNNGCDYLGIINDDVTDILLNSVLENGYFKTRGYQLMYQFGLEVKDNN